MKFLVAVLSVLIACATTTAAARSAAAGPVEFCPAQMRASNRLEANGKSVYSFDVHADSARTVSGEILADTNAGWFAFQFPAVELSADGGRYKSDYVEFSRDDFVSKELFVAFPANVTTINGWWVDKAQATGDGMGWERKGTVTCLPPAGTGAGLQPIRNVTAAGTDVTRTTPEPNDLKKMPGGNDVVYAVTPAKGLETACASPGSNATVTSPRQPNWPVGWKIRAPMKTLVEVAVSPEGIVKGTWVYQPSGTSAFDSEALIAAQGSTYAGGSAYCSPAPGLYLFSAVFTPN
jgi:hypothetical protein